MNLGEIQTQAKRDMDERKLRHPFPGGWRGSSQPTVIENAAARPVKGNASAKREGELPWFMLDGLYSGSPDVVWKHVVVRDGVVYALCPWIADNIVKPGWGYANVRSFAMNHSVRSLRLTYSGRGSFIRYDVEHFIRKIVATKTHTRHRLMPYVAEWLQGSRSISEALLAFVQDSAECRGNER